MGILGRLTAKNSCVPGIISWQRQNYASGHEFSRPGTPNLASSRSLSELLFSCLLAHSVQGTCICWSKSVWLRLIILVAYTGQPGFSDIILKSGFLLMTVFVTGKLKKEIH